MVGPFLLITKKYFMKCKSCIHWRPQQSELDYSKFSGICTCPIWEFNVSRDGDICVIDRKNPSNKYMSVHRFESQKDTIPYGAPNRSQYCLVTNENFGCIHFNNKNKKQ